MVKQTVVHPYHDIFPKNNKEQAIGKNNNVGESPETHAEWKKVNPKRLYTAWLDMYHYWNDKTTEKERAC